MEAALGAMEIALRVLSAVTQQQPPIVSDVEALRRLVPSLADAPVDELACAVIQWGLARSERLRKRTAAG